MQMVEPEEVYIMSVDLYKIKKHLKKYFDLDGNNQPWHMFDKLHFDLLRLAAKLELPIVEDNQGKT